MKKALLILPLIFMAFTGFAKDLEVYESEVFKASAPILIAGVMPLDFEVFSTPKASFTSSKSYSYEIEGELGLQYLDIDLKVNYLSNTLYINGMGMISKLLYKKIATKEVNLDSEYITSPFNLIVTKVNTDFHGIKTALADLSFVYTYSKFSEFYPLNYHSIETEKKGEGKNYDIKPSSTEKSRPSRSGVSVSRKTKGEESKERYTLIVVVTTPMSQVFNVFSKKETYLILEGEGIRREKYLGKLSGATPEQVTFENIPGGTYTLTLKWGNVVRKRRISVPDEIHVDFMITF